VPYEWESHIADFMNERWEVAYLALYLISHEASYVNGFTVNMDGGGSVGLLGRDKNDASNKAQSKL
jgi:hypothetical protein